MEVIINYFEKGKEKSRKIAIGFVPNHVYREYQFITDCLSKTYEITTDMQSKFKEIEEVSKNKPDGWKEQLQELSKELGVLSAKLREVEENDFFQRRYEIMKFLLIKNGIDENDKICTFEFWDEDVHPREILRILSEVTRGDSKNVKAQKKST